MSLGVLILGLVTTERGTELLLARRNTRRLLDRGAREVAPGHYPLIVALHAAWLAGLWLLARDRQIQWAWLAAFAMVQPLRFWVIATLGERWTTRIVVLPGAPLVRTGLYRFFDHPNYLVVIAEIALLPLAFGLPVYALVFSILNGFALAIRIRAENAALAGGTDFSARHG